MAYKILVVDDYPLVHLGLKRILAEDIDNGCQLLKAETLDESLIIIEQHHHDLNLVLLDLNLPDAKGLAALERIRSLFPAVPIAVLCAQDNPAMIQAAHRHNISGYLLKTVNQNVLVHVIRLMLSGGVYMPMEVMHIVANPNINAAVDVSDERDSTSSELYGEIQQYPTQSLLSSSQQEILYLITQGFSNKQISDTVHLNVGVTQSRISKIFRALGVSSRTQAINWAYQHPDLLHKFETAA